MITDIGLDTMANTLSETVVASTQSTEKNV